MKNKEYDYSAMVVSGIFFAAALVLFFYIANEYFGFVKGWEERFKVSSAEAQVKKPAPPAPAAPEIKFRKFYITAPGAKKVELVADFNGWGDTPIVLTPYNKGYFEVSLALVTGEYKYLFLVDGVEKKDVTNKDLVEFKGREVNVKTVR